MKKNINEIWKVQAPKGIINFNRKKDAIKWVESLKKEAK